MNYINLKNKLKIAAMTLPQLVAKNAHFEAWKNKNKELLDIANLCDWSKTDSHRKNKVLTSYSTIYDTFEAIYPRTGDEVWIWSSYRAFENVIKYDTMGLMEEQRNLTSALFYASMINVFNQYAQWREPVPDCFQLYVLNREPMLFPSLVQHFKADFVKLHNPELWTAWETISSISGDELSLATKLFSDWLAVRQEHGNTYPSEPLALPANFD